MQKLVKRMPVLLVILSIGLFNLLILSNENTLQRGQSVFVSLQPVDPRSLLQGDYMALRYEMHIRGPIPDAKRSKAYVKLNELNIVSETRFHVADRADAKEWVPILLKRLPHSSSFYPVTTSYLFAEGLADCYSHAKFAEFKVIDTGQAILYRLTDTQLKSLNCETQQRWQDGNPAFK